MKPAIELHLQTTRPRVRVSSVSLIKKFIKNTDNHTKLLFTSQPERIIRISEVFNAVIQHNIQQWVKAEEMMLLIATINSKSTDTKCLFSPFQHPTALSSTRELDPDLLVHELAQVQDRLLLLPLRLITRCSLTWRCRHPDQAAGTLK